MASSQSRLPGPVQVASGFGSFPSLKQQPRWIMQNIPTYDHNLSEN